MFKQLANLLVNYCIEVCPNDRLFIDGSSICIPLIEYIYEETLISKGNVCFIQYGLTDKMSSSYYTYANNRQLKYVPEWESAIVDEITCYVNILSDENTKMSTNADLGRQRVINKARKKIDDKWNSLMSSKDFRWVMTLFPTNAYAQDAEMSLLEFQDFVFKACKLYYKDPVKEWNKQRRFQNRIIKRLLGSKKIRIVSDNTDISMNVNDRIWINCSGKNNMPDGEVYTSPIEESVNGFITFTYPCCYDGREVENVRLTFKNGEVVEYSAGKNEGFLGEMINLDEGSRRVGEIAFGCNYDIQNYTKEILFDEKIGGTCHMALGSSYVESGGLNKSSLHWDMICDLRQDGKVYVDNKLLIKNGSFLF